MIDFNFVYPGIGFDHLGLIPTFLWPNDPRPAREQFDERYAHGGGWKPMPSEDWIVLENAVRYRLDDRGRALLAVAEFGNETIRIYDGAWVSITQPDGSFEIARMD
jgi:hypothetical protein